jgi:hypothetical protein
MNKDYIIYINETNIWWAGLALVVCCLALIGPHSCSPRPSCSCSPPPFELVPLRLLLAPSRSCSSPCVRARPLPFVLTSPPSPRVQAHSPSRSSFVLAGGPVPSLLIRARRRSFVPTAACLCSSPLVGLSLFVCARPHSFVTLCVLVCVCIKYIISKCNIDSNLPYYQPR